MDKYYYRDQFKFMVDLVIKEVYESPVGQLPISPRWVDGYVMREKAIRELIVRHLYQTAQDSGVYEGAKPKQIEEYKKDLRDCVNELMDPDDLDSFYNQITARWNPSNEYPGTRVSEIYDHYASSKTNRMKREIDKMTNRQKEG